MALAKRVTSKVERHAGYGLFLVESLIERNAGFMRLTSGRISKQFGPTAKRWKRGGHEEQIIEHLPWNGTEVSLIFDLDGPLPLCEVYKDLGPPEHAEDFFD